MVSNNALLTLRNWGTFSEKLLPLNGWLVVGMKTANENYLGYC
jgi:hypothetical protein